MNTSYVQAISAMNEQVAGPAPQVKAVPGVSPVLFAATLAPRPSQTANKDTSQMAKKMFVLFLRKHRAS